MKQQTRTDVQKITILIIAVAFGYALAYGIPNIVINYLIGEFSLSGTEQGMVASIINAGFLIAVLIAPSFQGRVSKLTMMTASMVLIALSLCVQGLSGSAGLFFAASLTVGLGFGWLDGYINSVMIDIHPGFDPVPMGLLHGFFGIGSLVFPIAATALLSVMIWRGLYFQCALFMALLAVVSFILTRSVRGGEAEANTRETKLHLENVSGYIKQKDNATLLILGMVAGCFQSGISCWLVRYTTLTFESEALGATALSCMWIASTLNRFVTPRIQISPLRLILLGLGLSAIALFVAVAAVTPAVLVLMIGLTGLFSGHLGPLLIIEAARTEQGNTTMTTFIMQIALTLGRILIPLVMAAISAQTSVSAGMVLPGVIAFIAALGGVFIHRKELLQTFGV